MKSKKFLGESNKTLISELQKNVRIKYTALAKKFGVTPAATKERVERLIDKKIIKVSALIDPQNILPTSAIVGIEADPEEVNILVRRLRNCPLLFHMTKTSGNHNFILSIATESIAQMEDFLNKQIRSEPGIRHIEVNISNMTIIPEYSQLRITPNPKQNEIAPCGMRRGETDQCINCPALISKEE